MGQVWSLRLIEACYQLANIIKSIRKLLRGRVVLRFTFFLRATICNGKRNAIAAFCHDTHDLDNIGAAFRSLFSPRARMIREKSKRMQRARKLPIAPVDLACLIIPHFDHSLEIGIGMNRLARLSITARTPWAPVRRVRHAMRQSFSEGQSSAKLRTAGIYRCTFCSV